MIINATQIIYIIIYDRIYYIHIYIYIYIYQNKKNTKNKTYYT